MLEAQPVEALEMGENTVALEHHRQLRGETGGTTEHPHKRQQTAPRGAEEELSNPSSSTGPLLVETELLKPPL